jgi:hypothetical protein
MKTFRIVSLVVFLTTAIVLPPGPGQAAVVDPIFVCISLKTTGLGAPHVDLTLVASPAGTFFQLTGQAVFSQSVAPPSSVIIYGVAGTALPTVGGFSLSLTGVGADLAQNLFNGTFAVQLGIDPAKNTLTYAKRSLDGTSNATITGAAEVVNCAFTAADAG